VQYRWTHSGYLWGSILLLICVLLLLPLRAQINSTPVALSFLLIVLFIAAMYGSKPAIAVSIAGVICFNYFFLPPYATLRIADPQNWIALAAFTITALIAGGLSASARRRAEEAERKEKEIENLYRQLKEVFAKAKEVDAAKQSEQIKSALLDAVTHDLRTPLTSMKAAITTLLAGNSESQSSFHLDEEGKHELMEVIDTEIDRLNHHLAGLIEIAKIEAGAMQPQRAWTNMEEIVGLSLARAAGILGQHKIKTEMDSKLPPVKVDEKSIVEVIYLLLENAAKYSASGSQILIAVKEGTDKSIKVSVHDEGPGIPEDLREKVFDKFFRSPQDSRLSPAGLGMGLAIARAVIEAHGGRIWIDDAPHARGACVSFIIPLKEN
jgi:K+-sensing histidine kinase KdpD